MKFKEYVNNLNKMLKERPETAELDVITSIDDEGNGYDFVHYAPTIGNYNHNERYFKPDEKLNAICIN